MDLISVSAFEEAAYTKLPAMAYDYFVGGADDEVTVRENRAAFQRLVLRNRVLVDVSTRNLATEVLGQSVSMPVLVAPMAFQKLAHSDGELGMALAVARSESILILSTFATTDVESVVPAAGGRVWFQLYVYRDREVTRGLVERVEAAGCKALVLTVDVPLLGRRERDVRNRFRLPDGLTARNLLPAGYDKIAPVPGDSGLAMYAATMLDGSLNWKDLEWLRSVTRLPILVKGIVRADDAIRAVEHGASGIIVSNHGGRQLDTAPATIDVLSEIVEAVGGQGSVLLDGGVRRGTDIVKAVALGAQAVLVGRAALWGLAVDGEDGAHAVLEIFRTELDRAMALCGCPTIAEITPDLVAARAGAGNDHSIYEASVTGSGLRTSITMRRSV